MSKPDYLTSPPAITGMPPGIPYIVGNEAAERFSFYGMKAILMVFMTKYLVDRSGMLAPMSESQAMVWFHTFVWAVYFLPLAGAFLADRFLGKYQTIVWLSLVYCLGHVALAVDDTRLGLALGLGLIAVGAGGIKPCVSAHVGDQFGARNQHLLEKVFGWFYLSINLGAVFSQSLAEPLLKKYGSQVAFGLPGVLMFVATLVFWLGRYKYVHVPPGKKDFVSGVTSKDGRRVLWNLFKVYAFLPMFWCIFDQTSSAWVMQGERMVGNIFGYKVNASQMQAVNPALILIFVPLFTYVIYPAINRVWPLTSIRKIGIGFFLTAIAFGVSALIEREIAGGAQLNIAWQIVPYIIITASEVMVSITSLEFSYTQAPKTMKSFVMSLYLLTVAFGNAFAAAVNYFNERPDHTTRLDGPSYYWFFTALMLITAVSYVVVSRTYRGARDMPILSDPK